MRMDSRAYLRAPFKCPHRQFKANGQVAVQPLGFHAELALVRLSEVQNLEENLSMRRPMLPSGLDLPRGKSRSEGRSKFGK